MKSRQWGKVVCNPRTLSFERVPMFGETVFRLNRCQDRSPKLFIAHKTGVWTEYTMVNEGRRGFYAALRLTPGHYCYKFFAKGVLVLDTGNERPIVMISGQPANVVHVIDITKEVSFCNFKKDFIKGRLTASSSLFFAEPSDLTLTPEEPRLVRVSVQGQDPSLHALSADLQLLREDGNRVLCSCPINVAMRTTVPSVACAASMDPAGNRVELDVMSLGIGTIKCFLLDRLTPKVVSFVLNNYSEHGCSGRSYRSGEFDVHLPRLFTQEPAFRIITDSPFPDERLWDFFFNDDGSAMISKRAVL